MEILLFIIFAVLGAAVGSFLNVCIDRLPAGKSLISPPSHCDSCSRRLSPAELVPVFSYLWLRGRCRHCGAPISPRQLLVEVISSLVLVLAFWRYGLSAQFALTAVYSYIFVVIAFIDLEHKLILNRITYPAGAAALAVLGVDSVFPAAGLHGDLVMFPEPAVLSGLIGGAVGSVFFLVVYLIYPGGMGMGDIKLAGLIGLALGFPLALVALFLGIFAGGIAAIILLITGRKGRKEVIPYGTFLSLGPVVTLLWGNGILNWYLGLF